MFCRISFFLATLAAVFPSKGPYYIYNKEYPDTRITQFSNTNGDIGTYSDKHYPDQLWWFAEHPSNPGCFYITNHYRPGWRLADHKHSVIVYNKAHYDDQTWRLEPAAEEGFFRILNCYHVKDKLTKNSKGDKTLDVTDEVGGDEQIWRLEHRFQLEIKTIELMEVDNRLNATNVLRDLTILEGVKRISGNPFSGLQYTDSMIDALGQGLPDYDLGIDDVMEMFSTYLENIVREFPDKLSKTSLNTFTVPAGKKLKVLQRCVVFKSKMDDDDFILQTACKTFETSNEEYIDPDDWIINEE